MDEILAPILAEIERRGLTPAAVSRTAAGNDNALKNLRVRRGTGTRAHPVENLQAIARALDLELRVVPRKAQLQSETAGFSEDRASDGFQNQGIHSIGSGELRMILPDAWFKRACVMPVDAEVENVSGSWMEPTLPSGASVVFDRSETDPAIAIKSLLRPAAPIYVCTYKGLRLVCRIERPSGTHYLVSFDNRDFSPAYVSVLDLIIAGRVVWCGRHMVDPQ